MLAPFRGDVQKWYGSTKKVIFATFPNPNPGKCKINTKVSKENSTVVPCIYTNVTFCDPAKDAAAKVAAGRFSFSY